MWSRKTKRISNRLIPLADRGPLRVVFLITSMPVGGAETLLVNLIRRFDRSHFLPELCCLKGLGPLGEELAHEIPVYDHILANKLDLRVLPRLAALLRRRRIDAVVTVGAGDKMFWGRLAARWAGVPVVCSALHSTGWPDTVGRMNRSLTPITDAFIAVAPAHGRFLIDRLGFPPAKVHVIPNGIDVERFQNAGRRLATRASLGLTPTTPTVGIVAALRPEKNHALLLQAAQIVQTRVPEAAFLIIGDGPERSGLETLARQLGIEQSVRFLGTRSDIPELLTALDAFVLTSRMEANPVSILEAMAVGLPVVAPDVGSISESVIHGVTGYLTQPNLVEPVAERLIELLENPVLARTMGTAGQQLVQQCGSLDSMVAGYQRLLADTYTLKSDRRLAKALRSGNRSATVETNFVDAT
jgi:glycosyltransferase involved in cell wall biosynthesis